MSSFDFFFPKRWRKADVKYSQNEIYLDVVEEMDVLISSNGQVMINFKETVQNFLSASFQI